MEERLEDERSAAADLVTRVMGGEVLLLEAEQRRLALLGACARRGRWCGRHVAQPVGLGA